jgi:predicted PurR-regulated permease PerM
MAEPATLPTPTEPAAPRFGVRQLAPLFGWAVALFLLFRFFAAFRLVLLCLLGAAILASALRPLATRAPGRRWASAVLVGLLPILLLAATLTATTRFLSDLVREQVEEWPQVRAGINQLLAGWSENLGLEDAVTVEQVIGRAVTFLTSPNGEMLTATTSLVTAIVIAVVLVLFGAMFLLGERRENLVGPALELLPPRRRAQLRSALDDLEPRLRWWLLGAAITGAAVGLAAWAGFSIIGLRFALALALLAAVAELVPTLGPTFAFLVASLVAATQSPEMVLAVVAVWAIVQGLESWVLVPLVMRRAVRMPPVVTLFTVVLWGKIFGLGGLLLAVPLNLVVWTFARHLLGREETAGPVGHGQRAERTSRRGAGKPGD